MSTWEYKKFIGIKCVIHAQKYFENWNPDESYICNYQKGKVDWKAVKFDSF